MSQFFYRPLTFPLNEMVHSIWETRQVTHGERETILPKGMVEILFNFSSGLQVAVPDRKGLTTVPRCFISGMNRKVFDVFVADTRFYFGIRLFPGTVEKLLGLPAGELIDTLIDLTLVNAAADRLWHRLIAAVGFSERVALISSWITGRYSPALTRDSAFNDLFTDHSTVVPGASALAQTLCYSPRQLSRQMRKLTGLNTEEYLLYKRFLRSVHLIHYTDLSLTRVGYECGFADQSHFIKTFNTLALLTPGAYKKRKSLLPGHLFSACPLPAHTEQSHT